MTGDNNIFISQNGSGSGSGGGSNLNPEQQLQNLTSIREEAIRSTNNRLSETTLEGVKKLDGVSSETLAKAHNDSVSRGDNRLSEVLLDKTSEAIRKGR